VPTTAGSVPSSCSCTSPTTASTKLGGFRGAGADHRESKVTRRAGGFDVEIPQHLKMVGHEAAWADRDRSDTALGEVSEVVVYVRLEPRRAGRAGAGLPGQVESGARTPNRLGHQTRHLALLAAVETAFHAGVDVRDVRHRVRREDQRRGVPLVIRQDGERGAQVVALAATKPG
jgi:hypothetical protein